MTEYLVIDVGNYDTEEFVVEAESRVAVREMAPPCRAALYITELDNCYIEAHEGYLPEGIEAAS